MVDDMGMMYSVGFTQGKTKLALKNGLFGCFSIVNGIKHRKINPYFVVLDLCYCPYDEHVFQEC